MDAPGRDARQLRAQSGFTFIEVLVVMVVIGVLAAIALPAFVGQRDLASDASAKSLARAGYGALETFAVQSDDRAPTREDVLAQAPELSAARAWSLDATATRFAISVTSDSDTVFTIARARPDPAQRTCSVQGKGGCPLGGAW